MPSHDHSVELQNLLLEPSQLHPEGCETRTRYARHSLIGGIGNNVEQFLDTIAPDWRDDPEFGEVRADCIDHGGLLTDKHMARAMEHQALCCSGVLVSTNRMLTLATASQMASASVASFF
jgi:hypothetical protein